LESEIEEMIGTQFQRILLDMKVGLNCL